ncbi:MAG TPA: hypothetical protein VE360_10450, partial [Pyrinomonadaceae bacterium]|nr:hypothetical protein [Pyrinomonadaceae bacterium]
FAGFFSKDEILWKTFSTEVVGVERAGPILWGVGAVTALLTAIYMTRLMAMTFWGKERFREAHAGGQADEAHAHAYDEKDKPHDARLASEGDRPHHHPADSIDAHAHDAAHAHSTAHDEAHSHDASHAHLSAHDADEEDEHEEHHHGPVEPHESPWVMTVPLVVLAVLSTFGGLVGVPYALSSLFTAKDVNAFEHALEPVVYKAPKQTEGAEHGPGVVPGEQAHGPELLTPPPQSHDGASPLSVGEGKAGAHGPATAHEAAAAHSPEHVKEERIFTVISVVIALAGIGLGVWLFGRRPLLRMPRLLENKYYVDEVYDAALVNPIKEGSRGLLWRFFDVGVIDGIVNGVGSVVTRFGAVARYLQPGFVRAYAAIILLGALAVVGFFAYNAYRALQ